MEHLGGRGTPGAELGGSDRAHHPLPWIRTSLNAVLAQGSTNAFFPYITAPLNFSHAYVIFFPYITAPLNFSHVYVIL